MALINLTQPFTRYSDRVGLDSKPLNRRREMQPVVFPTMQLTLPVAEDIDAGDVVWIDPKSGMYRRFDPTSFDDTEHMLYGVALQAGSPAATQERGITAVRVGMIAGYDLSAYDFGKEVWTSKYAAGRLDDNLGPPPANAPANAANLPNFIVGRVVPHHGVMVDMPDGSRVPAKVLLVEMSQE